MAKDYYLILGVSRNASAQEIKQAYRKLAHQYHPDKNTDHADGERFKEINEAYQVLSNPQKKAQYDQFGTVGENSGFGGYGQGFEGFDFSNFGFSQNRGFGGIGDIFEEIFSGAFSQVQSEVEIKLSQALLGDTVHLQTSQGEQIEFRIPPGTVDGQSFRFKGKGLPTRRGRGDLILTVRVKMPKNLSQKQKDLLEELKRTGI